MCANIILYVCMYVYRYVCMYTGIYASMYVRMCAYIHVYGSFHVVCNHVCMYVDTTGR